jgi:hypothetical protein
MFIYAMSIAAIGFVAFVLVFVHPASLANRGAAHQMSAGSDAATVGVSPLFAASK